MSLPRLLITESDRFTSHALDELRKIADVTLADLDREQLLNQVGDADILWIRLRHQVDAEVLTSAANLKFICSPTTGLNHIDLNKAESLGIQVISLRGEVDFLREIRATAEHTVGLMLALLRNLPGAIEHVRDGGWDRDLFCGNELHRKTIGIVGYGRLGSLVAKYLSAFDARIIATDPNVDPKSVPESVQLVSLDRLLKESDIVSIHVNLCSDTTGFFGADQIAAMKPGSLLINTSRGELFDESSLLAALESGQLAGAAVDVLSNESSAGMSDHPLVQFAESNSNLLITPHIGGCTTESMAKTELFLAKQLCAALQASSASV